MPTCTRFVACLGLAPCLPACCCSPSGCAFVSPRFSQEVQASFARDEMRKLTTRSMELYYPEHLKPAALRMAARVEQCVDEAAGAVLEQAAPGPGAALPDERGLQQRVRAAGPGQHAAADGDARTHEHRAVPPDGSGARRIWGTWGATRPCTTCRCSRRRGCGEASTSPTGGILQPNIFTESWFLEGLATYYEGHFDKETGRPHSPIWRGWFESVAQARDGELNAGPPVPRAPGDGSVRRQLPHRQSLRRLAGAQVRREEAVEADSRAGAVLGAAVRRHAALPGRVREDDWRAVRRVQRGAEARSWSGASARPRRRC